MMTAASQTTSSSFFERLMSILGFPELKGDAGLGTANRSPDGDNDDLDLTVDEEAVYLAMLTGPVPF